MQLGEQYYDLYSRREHGDYPHLSRSVTMAAVINDARNLPEKNNCKMNGNGALLVLLLLLLLLLLVLLLLQLQCSLPLPCPS